MQKLQDAADQKKISKKSTIPLPPGDGSESMVLKTRPGREPEKGVVPVLVVRPVVEPVTS